MNDLRDDAEVPPTVSRVPLYAAASPFVVTAIAVAAILVSVGGYTTFVQLISRAGNGFSSLVRTTGIMTLALATLLYSRATDRRVSAFTLFIGAAMPWIIATRTEVTECASLFSSAAHIHDRIARSAVLAHGVMEALVPAWLGATWTAGLLGSIAIGLAFIARADASAMSTARTARIFAVAVSLPNVFCMASLALITPIGRLALLPVLPSLAALAVNIVVAPTVGTGARAHRSRDLAMSVAMASSFACLAALASMTIGARIHAIHALDFIDGAVMRNQQIAIFSAQIVAIEKLTHIASALALLPMLAFPIFFLTKEWRLTGIQVLAGAFIVAVMVGTIYLDHDAQMTLAHRMESESPTLWQSVRSPAR